MVESSRESNPEEEEDVREDSFPSALFHVHEWIIESAELMAQFIALFQELSGQLSARLGVCRAVAYWIRACPTHFDASLCRLTDRLRLLAIAEGIPNANNLLDLSALPSYAWLRNVSVRNPVGRQISLSFEQWSADDISTSLSHIDYKALYRVPISELKRYCHDGNLSQAPILERSISIFNSLSNWVQCMILNKGTPAERAEIIRKFVNVAKHLRKLNNFNTLMAVIGGVTHSNIARLSKTSSALSAEIKKSLSNWVQCMILNKGTPAERAEIIRKFVNVAKHLRKLNNFNTLMAVIGGVTHSNIARLSKTSSALSAEIKKDLAAFTQLLSTQSNFAHYRRVLNETENCFRIPIMGVHLKDLIALQVKEGDMDRSRMVTRSRVLNLAHLLSFFVSFSRMPHNFPDPSIDLINTLKVSLDIRYNEDDIYHLSLKREPRTLLSFQSSAKSVVFADWASGVSCALDPETVNKHVSAMVDAVFKHYDHDKDGCISRVEFQQIAGNFPFIDPFGSIDIDRDGQISKSEMKAYFVEVNKRSMEFRRGFKHNFHETTFLTPTSCAHCGRLLWGLIRQGFKCKDCGLAVHGCCKDSAVVECRRRSGGTLNWCSPSANSCKHNKKLFVNASAYFVHLMLHITSPTASPITPILYRFLIFFYFIVPLFLNRYLY
ncbi:Ras guanyl-releasing protein 3 [Toxocara canis]|uniref:Ras guanyl-releasing protein 3 n=1 Tax=Toxocara canis TaxID=6265 RepID=A0A0B2VFG5_TOXCA|nr:Ras guanyl-releasing protein 3 [Toxocara canis]